MNQLNHQKGFLPILILILVGLATVTTGYIGYSQYQTSQVKKAENRELSDEIAKLREEVSDITTVKDEATTTAILPPIAIPPPPATKKTSPPPVPVTTSKSAPPPPVAATENFNEGMVAMLSKRAEEVKSAIDESKRIDIPELTSRRDKLQSRAFLIRSSISQTSYSDLATINEMLELYAKMHDVEITEINDRVLPYIQGQLDYLEKYRAAYSQLAASYLATKKIVTREEFLSALQQEQTVATENTYKAQKNIIDALKTYYAFASRSDDRYENAHLLISSALAKLSTPSIPASSYQPVPLIPESTFRLTARQELLLNPIQCSIAYDPIRTNVTCY